MIIDLLRFKKMRVNPDAQYHTLIIEMRGLNSKSFQIIYFYRIDCNQQTYQCELINTKQIVIHKNRFYEIHELYGVKNTPFNPEWNPNTIEDKECVICFCNMINTVLLPCKHMCTCSTCSDHILMSQKVKQCPLCRIDIDNYLTLEIKDKQKQDLQLKQFQEEQQKYLESIKEKKEQQTIKQSSIMEQIKSKLQEEQQQKQLNKMMKIKYFNDLDDFNKDNQQNEDIYGNQSFCSYDENISDSNNNQFYNITKNQVQHQKEDEINYKSSNHFDEDRVKSTTHQRSPQDIDFLSSHKLQQEMKSSKQYPNKQSISVEDDMSQDQAHPQQYYQVSSECLQKDDQSNLNSQQNSRNQDEYSKQKFDSNIYIEDGIQLNDKTENRKDSQDAVIEFQINNEQKDQNQQINSNNQLYDFLDDIFGINDDFVEQNNIKSRSEQKLQQQPQQFQQHKQQQPPTYCKQSYQNDNQFVEQDFQEDMNQFEQDIRNYPQINDQNFKTNQSQLSNKSHQYQENNYYTLNSQNEVLQNTNQIFDNQEVQQFSQRQKQEDIIKKSASVIDLQDQEEVKQAQSHSKDFKSDQISLIAFD